MIPFLNLKDMHVELEEELISVVRSALRGGEFVGGKAVAGFEEEFAAYCESAHCVAVGNGTDALRFALQAAGVKPGDVAITVPNTFIATTEAISQVGARPEFVDVDEATSLMDPAALRRFLSAECLREGGVLRNRRFGGPVTAIVPVHLYGQTVDMDAILEIADEFQLIVIEDACQAHGAQYFSKKENRWKTAGSMGKAAAFSFYPGKNLGACGEAGAITTNDASVARTSRLLRDHGQSEKYHHEIEGYNGRMDAIQAGLLRVKLKHLPAWTAARVEAAKRYDAMLADVAGVRPTAVASWAKPVYHLYVVHTKQRDELRKSLTDAGVGVGLHYPLPLHLQKAYAHLGYNVGDFPVSERLAKELLSLPMFPGLKAEEVQAVAARVAEFAATPVSVS